MTHIERIDLAIGVIEELIHELDIRNVNTDKYEELLEQIRNE